MSNTIIPTAVLQEVMDAMDDMATDSRLLDMKQSRVHGFDAARDALRAAMEQPDAGPTATAPEGWKLVPVEPKISMKQAALNASRRWAECDAPLPRTQELWVSEVCWKAMIEAAPQPPKHYDQQALDLCLTCGWKTMIPGDCCLNCARQQPPVVEQPPKLYPLPADLYDSKDWRSGTYAERVEWLHTMYESAKEQIAELERPRPGADPYLYYDPQNGDTWTQEAINDGCHPPDGTIALYTKDEK